MTLPKGEIKDALGDVAARYEIYDTGSSKVELDLGPVMRSLVVLHAFGSTAETVAESAALAAAIFNVEVREDSPWVEVKVGNNEYAIWRGTGDIFRVGDDGAVEDEPLLRMTP